jgi:hypothetical protein
MSLMIKNKTRQLMTVTLNSGETLHLAPDEVSQPLSEIETANNAKIQRLSNEGMIETAIISDKAPAHGGEAEALHRRKPKP